MTKKKTTTKKVTKQPKLTRGKAFNLDVRTPAQAETLITQLQMLKVSGGWVLMQQILEGNMAHLERVIITKVDPETGMKLSEAALDELRSKHAVFGELVGKPDELIEKFRKQSGGFIPAYDPYHVSVKQMLTDTKAAVEEESVGTLKS